MASKTETPCHGCPLRQTGAFTHHSDAEVNFIHTFKVREIEAPAGKRIVEEGSDSELYTLLSGWAFRYRTLSDGRRQILNFLLPGDFIGLHDQQASPHGIETLTPARLCVFPRARLWELYRAHPRLGFEVTWLCANEKLLVDENLVSAGQRTAFESVAMLLAQLYRRVESIEPESEGGILFPLTQQHIADALGLSLVHTNKTLRRLRTAGFYTQHEGRLKLGNPAALAQLAEYQALPQRPRPLI